MARPTERWKLPERLSAPALSRPVVRLIEPAQGYVSSIKKTENLIQHRKNAEYRLSIFNRFMLAALGAVLITPGAFSIFRTRVVRELGGWRHGHSTEDM